MLLADTLTVDTGLTTAWAYWRGDAFPWHDEFHCSRKFLTIAQRISFMSKKFDDVLTVLQPKRVILEMVEFWEGSDKSRISAVRGDIFNLALLIGAYMSTALRHDATVDLLSAREWKGQLTKEATAYRVHCINGKFYRSEHITDAVGMGFSRDHDVWHLKKEKFTK